MDQKGLSRLPSTTTRLHQETALSIADLESFRLSHRPDATGEDWTVDDVEALAAALGVALLDRPGLAAPVIVVKRRGSHPRNQRLLFIASGEGEKKILVVARVRPAWRDSFRLGQAIDPAQLIPTADANVWDYTGQHPRKRRAAE